MFEDAATARYQLQEALRMESLSDDAAVRAEIDDACARLIPDGEQLQSDL
jgi:hypothetical protein